MSTVSAPRSQAPSRGRSVSTAPARPSQPPAAPADRYQAGAHPDQAWKNMQALRQSALTRPQAAPDYAAILKSAGHDSPAFQALAEQARQGNAQALDALRQALGGEQSYRALQLLKASAGVLRPEDVQALGAVARGDSLSNHAAASVLARAAMAEPPREGAAQQVRDLLEAPGAILGLEDRRQLEDWMTQSTDGLARRQLAGHFLGSSRKDVAQYSQLALGQGAREGDKQAIADLGGRGLTRELRSRTLEILGSSAQNGHRTALDELLKASGSRDADLSRRALERVEDNASRLESFDIPGLGAILNDPARDRDVRGAAASALAQAGVYHQRGYQLDRILEQLVPAASKLGQDNPAARAMERLARTDKLDGKHYRALIANLGPDSARTLLSAPEWVRAELAGDLRGQLRGERQDLAADVLTRLSPDQVRREDLGSLQDPGALRRVFDGTADPAVRRSVSLALAKTIQPSDPRWDSVVKDVASSGDAAAKAALSGRLPKAPLGQSQLDQIGRHMQASLSQALRDESAYDPLLREYGQLLLAQQWANDPHAKAHGDVDPAKLRARLAELEARPELRERLERMRADATYAVTRQDVAEVAHGTARYLQSKEFKQRLSLLKPEEAQTALTQEYAKLAALDPEAAKKHEGAVETLMLETAMGRMNEQERQEMIRTAAEAARHSGDHQLADLLDRSGREPGALDGARLAPDLFKAVRGLRGLKTPPPLEALLEKNLFAKMGLPGGAGLLAKGLGVFGTVMSTLDSINEFGNGDIGGGIGKGMMAVGGAFMLVPGYGWVIGGSLQLAGFLVNLVGGESPEETMLRQLGVNKG